MQSLNDLLPWAGLIVGAVSAYYGARNAMEIQIARLQEQLTALKDREDERHRMLERRLDDHSNMIDQLRGQS